MDTNLSYYNESSEDQSFAEELSSGAFVIDSASVITSRIFFTEFASIIQRSLDLSDTLNIPVVEEPVNRENTKFLNSFISTQRTILEQIIVVAPKNAFEQNIISKLQEETQTEELKTLTINSQKNAFEHFFPDLANRLKISDILNLSEVYDYTKTRLIEPKERLTSRATTNPISFLHDLNLFFSKSGSSLFTKFQSLYSNMFGSIQNVRNITRNVTDNAQFLENNIENNVEKATKLIESITNIENTIENALSESENILDSLIEAFDKLSGSLGFISNITFDSSGRKNISIELDETNANTYIETANTVFDTTLGVDVKDAFDRLKEFASNLSNTDFGFTELSGLISQAKINTRFISNLIQNPEEFTQSWVLDTSNIQHFIETVSSKSTQIMSTIETSFKNLYTDLVSTVENVIDVAQQVSTTHPLRTREMTEAHQEAVQSTSDAFSRMNELRSILIDTLALSIRVAEQSTSNYAAGSSVENLSRSLKQTAENTMKNVRRILENFNLSSYYNDENRYTMSSALLKISRDVQRLNHITNEENIRNTLQRIDGILLTSSSQYRNINGEEAEYLLAAFSQLSNTVKTVFDEFLTPIETSIDINRETQRSLDTIGVSRSAVLVGAFRIPSNERYKQDERGRNVSSSSSAAGGGIPDSQPPADMQNILGSLTDALVQYNRDYGRLPTYNEILNKVVNNVSYTPGSCSKLSGSNGWDSVDDRVKAGILILGIKYGSIIRIISAYRSLEANTCAGGARNSRHMRGLALDCGITGINQQLQFCNLAYSIGFRGIGVYGPGSGSGGGFVHIDIGSQSDWDTSRGRTLTPFRYYDEPSRQINAVRRLTGPYGRRVFI